MSLLLGNLSSRVRRDDLERVFRRFGRCTIQLRGTFGLVFYDYPVNAERALKTLQGKKICGQLLTLSWSNSNRQPRPVPRFRGRNEQIDNLPNGNGLENVSEFDRYEPYSSDDKWDDNEINQGGSNTAENVHQRKGVVQIVTKKTQRGCYSCGELGHKMRNCPQKRAPKKMLNRFGHKRNDKFRRIESDPRERERPSRDAVTMRSRNRTHYSPVDNRIDNKRMKRTRESVSPERHRATKSRRSNLNPTTRSASNSNLKSRSLSSSSSSSTFSSKSQSHRSRNHRSRSGSRSRSSSRASTSSHSQRSRNHRSRSGSRSRSSSRVSTSSGPSSNSLKKTTSPPEKQVDTSFENPKLETMDTNDIKKCEKDTTHLEIQDLQEDGETAMVDRESDDGSRSLNRNKPMVITSEEMLMVIKHYGLKQDEGVDDNNSFFGCGRLWPWEVIYYRRLKKGPISNENYARRVLQNREFGIVDKYVRSSSGWREVGFDD